MANIVRLDKMAGTKDATKVKSVKIATDLPNGAVVEVKGLVEGEREVFETATPTTTTKKFVLLASPEVIYDNRVGERDLEKFVNVKEKPARGYVLCTDDIFSVTYDCLDGTPVVGNAVELKAGTTMKTVTSATASSTQIGKIIALENVCGTMFAVIEVQ